MDPEDWHLATDALAEGLVVQDTNGIIVMSNPAASRILGIEPSRMVGNGSLNSPWRTVYADGRERPGREHPAMLALASGQPRWADIVGVHTPHGDLIWLSANSVPLRSDDGEVTGVVTAFTDITAQRLYEETRLARESRLRAAQQLTGLAWWELDLQNGTHVWSEEMFTLVGLAPDGNPPNLDEFLALLHPADRPAAAALRDQGFDNGHRETFRVVHPDGSVHHLQSWTDVHCDEAGTPIRVLGATIDVTEREVALERASDGRAKLAAALDLNATAMWEWDVDTDRLTWSARMTELMGRDPNGPPPTHEDFLRCVHPDDRDRLLDMGRRQINSGVPEETTYRVVHPDGAILHVRAWTDLRTDRDGRVTHLWGTALDITDEQEYAARLRASEEHFRVAFDLAPIGMSMIGLTAENAGQYLRTNAAFQRMLGRTAEEFRAARIGELTHPDDRERDEQAFAALVRGEMSSLAFEKRYLASDGRTVHAWITSSVVSTAGERPYLITHAVDITERIREQAELKRLALTDTLTGLANRTLLNDRLDHALSRLGRSDAALGMLLLDVDRFKTVNDSLGHQVGDSLLVEVGRRLQSVIRGDCTVARLGGDEFVVLVEGLDAPDLIHPVARRILDAMRRPFDVGLGQPPISATVSIGVSIATESERTPSDLYREADLALYRAKDGGRDQYALFDSELKANADRRLTAENLLRRALAQDGLVPLFQPIVDLHNGRIYGAEALVRIEDEGVLVAPAGFIDVAEETGLIVEVDARMFELVAAEAGRLRDLGVPINRFTTNVSARTLEDSGFVRRAANAIRQYDIPRSMIRIELTERTLLAATPAVRDALDQLRELGLDVGLDDFGTGYSALAYLQSFPLEFLKIDRSFVSRLGVSARDDAVVAAVIDLAHAHDLVVVGEGVETQEQLDALRGAGCDRAQGYLMGKPMTAEQLVALVRSDPRW